MSKPTRSMVHGQEACKNSPSPGPTALDKTATQQALSAIPSVDTLLRSVHLSQTLELYGAHLCTQAIKSVLSHLRHTSIEHFRLSTHSLQEPLNAERLELIQIPSEPELAQRVQQFCEQRVARPKLVCITVPVRSEEHTSELQSH